jgi:hypothetical protein
VGDKVGLDEAGRGVVPIIEGADRNLVLEELARLGGGDTPWMVRLAVSSQDAVGSGSTNGEQLRSHVVGELEMAIALKARKQLRQEGDEALGTDEVGSGPGGKQGILDGRSVASLARALDRRWRKDGPSQETDGVLAGIAGGGDKFIEDQRLV